LGRSRVNVLLEEQPNHETSVAMSNDAFEQAQSEVHRLPQTPSNDELLELYALYKQATIGDASGKRPSMLEFRARAKYDAWIKCAGTTKADAQTRYVNLVARLKAKYVK
jgi:diazepam-binding inhibitor (GABA receptor modulator, acyl-CoA-binding protein)